MCHNEFGSVLQRQAVHLAVIGQDCFTVTGSKNVTQCLVGSLLHRQEVKQCHTMIGWVSFTEAESRTVSHNDLGSLEGRMSCDDWFELFYRDRK